MQTLIEHLLTHLAEEAGEIVQRVMKIQRFGLEEIQEGRRESNQERLQVEVNQFIAVAELLRDAKVLPGLRDPNDRAAKLANLRKYAEVSVARGKLEPDWQYKLLVTETRPTSNALPVVCDECGAKPVWQRDTQFGGTHYFCQEHTAKTKNSRNEVWTPINQVQPIQEQS